MRALLRLLGLRRDRECRCGRCRGVSRACLRRPDGPAGRPHGPPWYTHNCQPPGCPGCQESGIVLGLLMASVFWAVVAAALAAAGVFHSLERR